MAAGADTAGEREPALNVGIAVGDRAAEGRRQHTHLVTEAAKPLHHVAAHPLVAAEGCGRLEIRDDQDAHG